MSVWRRQTSNIFDDDENMTDAHFLVSHEFVFIKFQFAFLAIFSSFDPCWQDWAGINRNPFWLYRSYIRKNWIADAARRADSYTDYVTVGWNWCAGRYT